MSDTSKFDQLFKLPDAQIKELQEQKKNAAAARKALDAIEELGITSPEVKADLDRVESMVDVLLERFTGKPQKEK